MRPLVVSLWLGALVALATGCTCRRAPPELDAGVASAVPTCPPPVSAPSSLKGVRPEPTTATPHVMPLAVCDSGGRLPLDAARDAFDHQRFEEALSCAAQASALSPGEVLAHVERGNALAGLERFDEAKLAYARALAIDPDSLDGLLGAAHLYAVQLPSSREVDELGALYAERGFELAQNQHDQEFSLSFARIAAMALNDVGQPQDALERADWVLAHHSGDGEALYERAVALFELCRFEEARPAFEALLKDAGRAPFAHYHLGLVLERQGHQADADRHFETASRLDERAFPKPVLVPADELKANLARAVAALPDDMRRDLDGVPVALEEIPALDDLVANEPPLSPTILGLFRGPSLGEPCEPSADARAPQPCRSIVLYRRNLGRAVKTPEELWEQVRVTLLHEVGHLRGEDDGELAARGLE